MSTTSVITLAKADVLAMTRAGGWTCNALSPLAKLPASQSALSQEGNKRWQDPAFHAQIERLALPERLLTMRLGGGDWPIQEMCLCQKGTSETLSGIRPLENDQVELLSFVSTKDFIDWWCESHANNTSVSCPNFLPPPIRLSGFIMALQAIDAFRRVSLERLLRHEPYTNLSMTPDSFTRSCQAAINGRDPRWLTPAFLLLVPGLFEWKPDAGEDVLRPLYDGTVLAAVPDTKTAEARIGFGEAGQVLGLEFMRSWIMACGMELKAVTPGGVQLLGRCFVAPTGVTNHFVQLFQVPDGALMANHQTCTGEELSAGLVGFLNQITPAVIATPSPQTTPVSPQTPPPPPVVSPQKAQKFCISCGTKLEATAAFCDRCGARQNE